MAAIPRLRAGLVRRAHVQLARDGGGGTRCEALANPAVAGELRGEPGMRQLVEEGEARLVEADGQVRTCLFSTTETDLRGLLRAGASDDEVARAWGGSMLAKLPGHGINDPGFLQPTRPMSAIGG